MAEYKSELVKITCPRQGCHAINFIDSKVDERLRETHEDFYCIYGHAGNYPQKTEAEKLRQRLAERDTELFTVKRQLAEAQKPKKPRKPRAKKSK